MSRFDYPLRPLLPSDVPVLRELFAASIEELAADDYTDEQRMAGLPRERGEVLH